MFKKIAMLIGAVKKDYSYYEKRSPGKGRKVVLKEIYGSRFSKKTGIIIEPLPKLGNYWLVEFGKDRAAINANDFDRIVVSRK